MGAHNAKLPQRMNLTDIEDGLRSRADQSAYIVCAIITSNKKSNSEWFLF